MGRGLFLTNASTKFQQQADRNAWYPKARSRLDETLGSKMILQPESRPAVDYQEMNELGRGKCEVNGGLGGTTEAAQGRPTYEPVSTNRDQRATARIGGGNGEGL